MTRRVLVVDDDPLIRQVVVTLLDLEAFDVDTAASVEDALELCAAKAPDLIVSDVNMPGADGFEFCRRLRSETWSATIPVVLLTARDEATDRPRADEVGADAYFTKPFSPLALLETIDRLLDGRD